MRASSLQWLFVALTVFVTCDSSAQLSAPIRQTRTRDASKRASGSGIPRFRPLRVRWRFRSGTSFRGNTIKQIIVTGNRVIYSDGIEVGCLLRSSGRLMWKADLGPRVPQYSDDPRTPERPWSISVDGSSIYAVDAMKAPDPQTNLGEYHLIVLDIGSGNAVWSRKLNYSPLRPPTRAGRLLLQPDILGGVTALNSSDGRAVWRTQLAKPDWNYRIDEPCFNISLYRKLAVIQIGAGRIDTVRLADGKQLWTWQSRESPDPQEGESRGIAIRTGVAYVVTTNKDLTAFDIPTGRIKWKRSATSNGYTTRPVFIAGGRLIMGLADSLVAIDSDSGRTVWYVNSGSLQDVISPTHSAVTTPKEKRPRSGAGSFLATVSAFPLINRKPQTFRSVGAVETVVAIDPLTGAERWRAQPLEGFRMETLCVDDDKYYFSIGEWILCLEIGEPDPLPSSEPSREALAKRIVDEEMSSQILRDDSRYHGDLTETRLKIIRLGKSSVPALLAVVRDWVAKDSQHPKADKYTFFAPKPILPALDLLLDICQSDTPIYLARELDRSKEPATRFEIAKTLIRFGDTRALPALFRFAKGESEEPNSRLDALYFVCHGVSNKPSKEASALKNQVTEYLLRALRDSTSPDWLGRFARIELQNDRGLVARKAALSGRNRTGEFKLMPSVSTLKRLGPYQQAPAPIGFPAEFKSAAMARDANGIWWAAFYCRYLGGPYDLWFVHSKDRQVWEQPAFGLDLQGRCSPWGLPMEDAVSMSISNARIDFLWREFIVKHASGGERDVRHRDSVDIGQLYADADHDGVPDLVERAIGTDPRNPDTNGNGIPDGRDRSPAFTPHKRSEEEAIYQAVLEALSQSGVQSDARSESEPVPPVQFGAPASPLVLPLPPGSPGVNLSAYPGIVTSRRLPDGWLLNATTEGTDMFVSARFVPPLLGIDRRAAAFITPVDFKLVSGPDPFAPLMGNDRPFVQAFHEQFPYELSRDKRRARVGWLVNNPSGCNTYTDVEVRKIANEWYPIECRRVLTIGGSKLVPEVVVPVLKSH